MFYTNWIPISSPPPCFLSSKIKKNAETHPPPMRKVTIEQTLMKFLQNLEKNSNNCTICKRCKPTIPKPTAGNLFEPNKMNFNQIASIDLKHRNSKLITHVKDVVTRYKRKQLWYQLNLGSTAYLQLLLITNEDIPDSPSANLIEFLIFLKNPEQPIWLLDVWHLRRIRKHVL